MTDRPEISVVIPTRNRVALLTRRALPSALGQEDVEHEIIVVDDGSTDATETELGRLQEPRLRVVRHDAPKGVAAARNAGIDATRGAWVAFLDDDDLWSPRKLRAQLDRAHVTGADLVYASAVAVDERFESATELYLPDAAEVQAKLDQACVVPAGCSNVIVRTELVRAAGGFDERLANLADWDLWIRLGPTARFAVCDEPLVAYVLHDDNLHVVADPQDELDYLIAKHAAASPPRRIAPDRLGHSRWVASQRSRAGRHGQAARVYLRSAVRHRSPGNLLRAADALLGKRVSALSRTRPASASDPIPDWLHRDAG